MATVPGLEFERRSLAGAYPERRHERDIPTVSTASMGVLVAASGAGIRLSELVVVALLLVASLVAIVAHHLRVPYSVALVLGGLVLGLSGAFSEVHLTRDVILLTFLPPLVFEGVLNLDLAELRRRWLPVALLAVLGTLATAAFIALPLLIIPGIGLSAAVLLAVMLAPTDPVAVLAVFKESRVSGGLRTILEAESLFNDALAIVLYLVAFDLVFDDGAGPTLGHALRTMGTEVGLGLLIGATVGFVAHRLMSTTDDHLIEITLSLVSAYGAYLVADSLGGSGVLATILAGLLIGNYGQSRAMSARSREVLAEFWEVLAFLANSALFLLIGIEFRAADFFDGPTLGAVALCVVAMTAGRAAVVYGLLTPFRPGPGRNDRHPAIPLRWRPAVFWGGLRGSIPIALVLGLPRRGIEGVNATALIFGVVLFSLIVQGSSYRWLLVRLNLASS